MAVRCGVDLRENRVHQRKASSITVTFQSGGAIYQGAVSDLSHGGAFIQFEGDVEVGSRLSMEITYFSSNKPFKVQGEVVSSREEGIGVQFDTLSQEQQGLLGFLYW